MPKRILTANQYTNRVERAFKERELLKIGSRHKLPGAIQNRYVRLTSDIYRYRKGLRKAIKYEAKIKAVSEIIRKFFGVTLWNSKKNNTKLMQRPKQFFYKYLYESRIAPGRIARFIGITKGSSISRLRKKLNAAFINNDELYQSWITFKNFVNLHINEL